jgi:hypothetical protein
MINLLKTIIKKYYKIWKIMPAKFIKKKKADKIYKTNYMKQGSFKIKSIYFYI